MSSYCLKLRGVNLESFGPIPIRLFHLLVGLGNIVIGNEGDICQNACVAHR